MRRRLSPLVGALFVAGFAVAQTDRLPPGAVLIEAGSVRAVAVDAKSAILEARLAAGAVDEVVAMLAAIPDPFERESRAARLLDRLQGSGTDAPPAMLDALERTPVLVYRRHEETAADWFVPVYDIPAKVQSLRRLQVQRHAVAALRTRLQGKDADAALTALAAAEPRVAALAVESASDAAVMRLAKLGKHSTTQLPSAALAALAQRTRDPADLLRALDRGAPLDVLPLFESTLPKLVPDDALRVLREALARPDYASVAAFALVALAPRDADAAVLLEKALDAPATGASIAAALAQSPDGLARIDALLASATQPATLRHLALALRLDGSAQALERLDRLRADPRLPATARMELQR